MPKTRPAPLEDQVRHFFDGYSRASDALDSSALTGCFAEMFLAADATGTKAVPREAFLQALPRRAEMFANAGIGHATLGSLSCHALDEHYVLARQCRCLSAANYRFAGRQPRVHDAGCASVDRVI